MDEGIGVRAVETLRQRFRFPEEVELLDGGTSGIGLLSYLRNRKHLIIIDAVRGGQPPGTVIRMEGEDVPRSFRARISPHQIGLTDLLATAALTGDAPEHQVLFGVEPERVETGLGLSQAVECALQRLVQAVIWELQMLGYDVTPRPASSARGEGFWSRRRSRNAERETLGEP